MVEIPPSSFTKINHNNYYYKNLNGYSDYIYHTEQDIVEYLHSVYNGNANIKGTITIVSERAICDNCWHVLDQFQNEFPYLTIVRVATK